MGWIFVHIFPVIDNPDPDILGASLIKKGMLLWGSQKWYNHPGSQILLAINPTDENLFIFSLDDYLWN